MGRTSVETIFFIGAEKSKASPSEIETVEYQAYISACAHAVETGKPTIWIITGVGTKIRLWIFTIGREYLIPYVPVGNGLEAIEEYLDAMPKLSKLIVGLEYIRDNFTPSSYLLRIAPSRRPANAVPPNDWHDNEVHLVDSYRRDHINAHHPSLPSNWRSELLQLS
ncbi:hypothetical protein F4811DRAFT_482175 [Daldinia bambusicola]|nr:hypothetical protein F4811DRAFT_482175 [Daldinia bambusicola]